MYHDKNIKSLLNLMQKRNVRHLENLIWRGGKLGISKTEVVDSVALLLDLKVLTTVVEETGDGWNTRGKDTFIQLVK
ncbi:MAG: hypothetical protein GOVbin225_45 [Prokaryotic dsDNA virus sp.]|nr:MAG: hypothetical protein GOVbin225_45 [Prokaryotic dsDNA virus sp.]|tara:strand:+ start:104 stop:334 length:231 start_codon:yes stop_codon:yes gene_type:complete